MRAEKKRKSREKDSPATEAMMKEFLEFFDEKHRTLLKRLNDSGIIPTSRIKLFLIIRFVYRRIGKFNNVPFNITVQAGAKYGVSSMYVVKVIGNNKSAQKPESFLEG